MIDYKAIADGDIGGDLTVSFQTMKSEVVTSTPKTLISYIDVANSVGLIESAQLQAKVLANLPAWVDSALSNGGINVNDPQVSGTLSGLTDETFTQDVVNSIVSLGVVSSLKYPGLREGYLQNARQKRLAGEI